jgi:glyoxylase-like metal-dependent hydrolase (beta-lactamase superfamily II)/ferredoxin
MADPKKRLPANAAGAFYVDSTCINCDTCRQLAPQVFDDSGPYSFVRHQPDGPEQVRQAARALLACPTHSIGQAGGTFPKEVQDDFPLAVEGPVSYMGFNSAKSYGGNSYLIRHPGGNWLVDSPQYLSHLVKKLEAWGGLKYVYLTHGDDVADSDKYAAHFGARRVIHEGDISSAPDAEIVLKGEASVEIEAGFRVIPSPGHTRGHSVLVHDDKYLFTGDHLAWDREGRCLDAWKDYCWYSWERQIESMKKLRQEHFEWVLPGHGQKVKLEASEMQERLAQLLERMEAQA